MPKKKAKKGGKKKGRKKGDKEQTETEKSEMIKKTKDLLKFYPANCSKYNSSSGAYIITTLKQCIEVEKPLAKIILDPQISRSGPIKGGKKNSKKSKAGTVPSTHPVSDVKRTTSKLSAPSVQVQPLLCSLNELRYHYIRCLHVWHLELTEEDLVSLALFMVGIAGSQIRVLELTNNNVTSWGIQRLSRTFTTSQIVHLTLDYNRLTVDSIAAICHNLRNSISLISLNLNYCHLTAKCGEPLGSLVTTTQLRYLSLRGNNLQSKGVEDFLGCLVTVSERNEMMPLLERLFLQDNAIDGCGAIKEASVYASVSCMQVMRRWVASCKNVEEVRLEGNLLGDASGREILQGLQQRKEAGYPALKLGLTNKISTEIFSSIMALCSAGGKKKRKGKKKGKKKK